MLRPDLKLSPVDVPVSAVQPTPSANQPQSKDSINGEFAFAFSILTAAAEAAQFRTVDLTGAGVVASPAIKSLLNIKLDAVVPAKCDAIVVVYAVEVKMSLDASNVGSLPPGSFPRNFLRHASLQSEVDSTTMTREIGQSLASDAAPIDPDIVQLPSTSKYVVDPFVVDMHQPFDFSTYTDAITNAGEMEFTLILHGTAYRRDKVTVSDGKCGTTFTARDAARLLSENSEYASRMALRNARGC